MQAIQLEKKQLLQQWNSSLIGMRRRDEAYAAMQEAVRYAVTAVLVCFYIISTIGFP